MIGITEFYNKVLPSQGVYCIITIEPKEGRTRHHYVESIAELEPEIEKLKPLGTNIYVSHSTYKGYKRGKEEAIFSRAFFIDLDVDPQEDVPDEEKNDKKYKTKEEAEAALDTFIIEFNLPPPIKFDSGRGIWAWWAFDKDIPIEEWKLYSEVFKKYCLDNNLKIDPNVTADAARATRTPNCTNWKANPPAETKVLSDELPVYIFDEFKEFLDSISPTDLSVEAVLKLAKKGLTQEEREAQGASDWENSFTQLLDASMRGVGCNQIKFMMEQPDKVTYDLWTAGLTVAARCIDSETAIHTISEKGPTYSREATILKAASFGGIHPCSSFENSNPGGCDGCIKKGFTSNPLIFARRLRETPIIPIVPFVETLSEQVATIEQSTALATPFIDPWTFHIPSLMLPFFRGPNGGVYMELPSKIDAKTGEFIKVDPILICDVDVWASRKLIYEGEDGVGDALIIRAVFKHDERREFIFPLSAAYSPDKLMDIFARKSITILRKNVIHFMDYIIGWGGYLRNHGRSDTMRTHFGWTKDRQSFIWGSKELKRDGTEAHNAYSPQTRDYGPLLTEKGNFELWRQAVNNLNIPGFEVHAFAMLAGFASTLMPYGTVNGITICLSGKAGSAKTGIMYAAGSMWGDPEAQYIKGNGDTSEGSTANGLRLVMSALGNIPMMIDEVTNMNPKQVSPLLHMIANGKAKVKAQGSTNAIRTLESSARLISVMTSNDPLSQKLSDTKADPNGELARLVEFNIGQPQPLKDDPSLGTRTFEIIKNHFGHAGPMFIKAIFDIEGRGELLRDVDDKDQKLGPRFQKWVDRYIQDVGYDPAERFHHNAIGLCLGAGEICNEYGILDNLDVERVYKVIASRMLDNKNTVAKINNMDCEGIIGSFILKNIQNILTVKNKKVYEEPKGSLVIRIEMDTNTTCIPKILFETYLKTEAKVTNIGAFKEQLKTSGIDYEIKKTRMTSFWDKVPAKSEDNIECYKFRRPELIDKLKETELDEQFART